jgi:hypothetical protein
VESPAPSHIILVRHEVILIQNDTWVKVKTFLGGWRKLDKYNIRIKYNKNIASDNEKQNIWPINFKILIKTPAINIHEYSREEGIKSDQNLKCN